MPDQKTATFSGPTDGHFHPLGRAPRASHPKIIVEYDGQGPFPPLFTLDIGVGEPGQEQSVLPIGGAGTFGLAAPVPARGLLSVRVQGLPAGRSVTIKVVWKDPK